MKATYRAAQAEQGVLTIVDLPVVPPGPGQVRIRVEACGVCHSDALTVENLLPGLSYPRVPGHEVLRELGRVAGLGEIDIPDCATGGWSVRVASHGQTSCPWHRAPSALPKLVPRPSVMRSARRGAGRLIFDILT